MTDEKFDKVLEYLSEIEKDDTQLTILYNFVEKIKKINNEKESEAYLKELNIIFETLINIGENSKDLERLNDILTEIDLIEKRNKHNLVNIGKIFRTIRQMNYSNIKIKVIYRILSDIYSICPNGGDIVCIDRILKNLSNAKRNNLNTKLIEDMLYCIGSEDEIKRVNAIGEIIIITNKIYAENNLLLYEIKSIFEHLNRLKDTEYPEFNNLLEYINSWMNDLYYFYGRWSYEKGINYNMINYSPEKQGKVRPQEGQVAKFALGRGYPKEFHDVHYCYILKDFGETFLIIPISSIKDNNKEINDKYEMSIDFERNHKDSRLIISNIRVIDCMRLVDKCPHNVITNKEVIKDKVLEIILC